MIYRLWERTDCSRNISFWATSEFTIYTMWLILLGIVYEELGRTLLNSKLIISTTFVAS